jgi:hypothetical protein
MTGRTKDGPGMKLFLVRYEICSSNRRKRRKHIMYEINCISDKDVVIDNMDLMRLVVLIICFISGI